MEEAKEPKQPKKKLSLKQAWFVVLIVGVYVIALLAINLYMKRTVYVQYTGNSGLRFEYPNDWIPRDNKPTEAPPLGYDIRSIFLFGPGTYYSNSDNFSPNSGYMTAVGEDQALNSYSISVLASKTPEQMPMSYYDQINDAYPDIFSPAQDFTSAQGLKMKIRSAKPAPATDHTEAVPNAATNAAFEANGYNYFVIYAYPSRSTEGMDPLYAGAFMHLLDTFEPVQVSTN